MRSLGERGVTLVEIAVVLSVVGVVSVLGVPKLVDWSTRSKLKSAAQVMAGDMMLARGTALAENRDCSLTFDSGAPQGYDISTFPSQTTSLPTGIAFGFAPGTKGPPNAPTLSPDGDGIDFAGNTCTFRGDRSADTGWTYLVSNENHTYAVGIPVAATGIIQVWHLSPGTTTGWKRL